MAKPSKPTASASQLVEVAQARPTTTSRIIAKQWGRKHFTVVNAIEKQLDEASDREFIGKNFLAIEFVDARGRVQREWQMTEDGFAAVAMGFTGKRSLDLRIQFTKAFREANERIRELERRQSDPNWQVARRETKDDFKTIGWVLQAVRARDGKSTERHHHINEALIVRHALTGDNKSPLDRNSLSAGELKVLAEVQRVSAQLLIQGEPFPLRKARLRLLALELLDNMNRRGRSLIERNGLGRGRLAGGAA
jgi:Rha family phage regulatory protein